MEQKTTERSGVQQGDPIERVLLSLTESIEATRRDLQRLSSLQEQLNGGKKQISGGAQKIIVALIILAIAGAYGWAFASSERMARLEESRFTSQQAYQMEARILTRIELLPADWARNQLADHEARLRSLESIHSGPGDGVSPHSNVGGGEDG